MEKLSGELLHLSSIAETHPQAAYACFTHGLVSKWTYFTRSMENISHLLQPLEDTIRTKLLPTLCGRPGIVNLASTADQEYSVSKEVTSPIVNSILSQEALADQLSSVAEIKKRKRSQLSSTVSQLKASLPPDLQRAMDLSQKKGACLKLAHCAASGGIWFLPYTQGRL